MKTPTPPTCPGLTHVGRYRRRMPVSLARMYENALDWEHLPHLHDGSFSSIHCLAAGDWGWKAEAKLAPPDHHGQESSSTGGLSAILLAACQQPVATLRYAKSLLAQQRAMRDGADVLLELRLDRSDACWITTTLAGPGSGSEIWTRVIEHGPKDIEVFVDFMLPDVPRALTEWLGGYFIALYTRLYDEDESMMRGRQQALDALKAHRQQPHADSSPADLGTEDQLLHRLPMVFKQGGKDWRLIRTNGQWLAHSVLCPHMLGPLESATVAENGVIECPWHGYRFDVSTGRNLDGHACRLVQAPNITIDHKGNVLAGAAISPD